MIMQSRYLFTAFVGLLWIATPHGCLGQVPGAAQTGTETLKGNCFYYSDTFHGRTVASGELYDKESLTAAHNTLPFGTMVKVTNLKNNKSIVVQVNDRYPPGVSDSKIIEVTTRGARELGMLEEGKAEVQIETVQTAKQRSDPGQPQHSSE